MAVQPDGSGVHKGEVGLFLLATLGFSAVFWVLIISAGTLNAAGGLYVMCLMWCPGIAALATRLIRQRNVRDLGWVWGKTRYEVVGYLLPILYAGVVYGLVWLTGLGERREEFGANLFYFIGIGTALSLFTGLGEELGWRGYLVPRLHMIGGFTRAALLSGFIWTAWHVPLLVFADYNAGAPVWYSLLCFAVLAVGASFPFAWLRLKSGSVWPAALLHASHNLYIQGYFDQVTVDSDTTRYLTGEFGAGLALVAVVLAYVFWRLKDQLPATGPQRVA